ncbi:MAG TPA: hypothetical protein PLR32_05725 [candidate division Zixibacteria bacterium]|nr:hypothetical protein [candidate division Zixibacteria bacterium]MDD4916602.1 hypothetical protein [candidate division Zixibacteria bacterium]MDM7973554.1 hypothetical protein [candidate division Zixibacteria bacterium]HOD65493.1 hypothetical protein [candidate division Zixibacteria bacterium]HOZ06822.1 hypothetical protein [candidate division Zixibacteria bacterium]
MRDEAQRGKHTSSRMKRKGRPGQRPARHFRGGSDEAGRRPDRRRQLEQLAETEAEEMLRQDESDEFSPS